MSELAAIIGKLSVLLTGPDMRQITSKVAFQAKQDATQALRSDLPAGKFTNWKPKLSVGYEILDDTSAKIYPRPSAPWKVLDVGRSPGGKFVRKRGRFIAWGATHGKGTWTNNAEPKIAAETPKRIDQAVQIAIAKALS